MFTTIFSKPLRELLELKTTYFEFYKTLLKCSLPVCCRFICFPTSALTKSHANLSTCVLLKVGWRKMFFKCMNKCHLVLINNITAPRGWSDHFPSILQYIETAYIFWIGIYIFAKIINIFYSNNFLNDYTFL